MKTFMQLLFLIACIFMLSTCTNEDAILDVNSLATSFDDSLTTEAII